MAYDKKFMRLAANEAQKNVGTQIGGPFGTVIVKDGTIVAQGKNSVLSNDDPTAHGEIQTIRKACKKLKTHDLSGCELYTNAYPCPMCLGAIIWSNIKTCYYGNTPEDADKIGFRDDVMYKFLDSGSTDKSTLNLEQHDRDLTIKAFQDFKENESSTVY
ncbi:nucleoside deaminase [Companilactobacillus halodurans]|uniref:Nucleoside deaminase n=1 Tax=Companilactobacillus halodurans TaxID=2584183 RepID=A0A5P0ZWS8_9LACO|nr:nucleoside deaminase [Companilactobacillus halodurans]MQS75462.1 nucleoside deaminase [Companilactobacillus halodurans]MQS97491.1 nucleoside deaminase [Companilactobacillus halodurans]